MALEQSMGAPAPTEPSDPIGDDARVAAVLAVLRGASVEETAREWAVDGALLQRWVSGFVAAGTAQVSNRPDPDAGGHRDRFLAAFAYEMREPLSLALGWVGFLGDPALPSDSVAETAGRLEEALDRLARRVDDAELLVAAALGGLSVQRSLTAVRDLCAPLDELDPSTVRGKGPDLEIDVDAELFARVLGDLWRTAALEPTPRARRLWVSVVGPWVELRILREGEPIDTDLLQALFEPFGADHLSSGVSTGLYLARALTVAHGGTIGVDQDETGAALWVRVPYRPVPKEPATARTKGEIR